MTRHRQRASASPRRSPPGRAWRRARAAAASSRFTLGRRQLGHLHGDRAFHGGFPKEVWHELFDQGRIDYHPVFPGKPGYAARAIESAEDVEDVIAMIRLNYDRAVARHGLLAAIARRTSPEPLPFAPSLHIRAFLLERDARQPARLQHQVERCAAIEAGGVARHYLNHRHEAGFASDWVDAPLFVHEAERSRSRARVRHVLDAPHGRRRLRGDPDSRATRPGRRRTCGTAASTGSCSPATRST